MILHQIPSSHVDWSKMAIRGQGCLAMERYWPSWASCCRLYIMLMYAALKYLNGWNVSCLVRPWLITRKTVGGAIYLWFNRKYLLLRVRDFQQFSLITRLDQFYNTGKHNICVVCFWLRNVKIQDILNLSAVKFNHQVGSAVMVEYPWARHIYLPSTGLSTKWSWISVVFNEHVNRTRIRPLDTIKQTLFWKINTTEINSWKYGYVLVYIETYVLHLRCTSVFRVTVMPGQ